MYQIRQTKAPSLPLHRLFTCSSFCNIRTISHGTKAETSRGKKPKAHLCASKGKRWEERQDNRRKKRMGRGGGGRGRKEKEFSFPNIFPSPVECTTLANWKKCAPTPGRLDSLGCMLRARAEGKGQLAADCTQCTRFSSGPSGVPSRSHGQLLGCGVFGGISSAGWQDSSTRTTVRARMADNLSSVPFLGPSPLSSRPFVDVSSILRKSTGTSLRR